MNATETFARWLPISTAPQDSTVIDIWTRRDGRLTNYYRVKMDRTNTWYDPVECGPTIVRNATHWMPIPDQPHPDCSVTVMDAWWVFQPSDGLPSEPYTRYSGPFLSKEKAEVWIGKQNGWPKGLRAGRSAILWEL